MTGQVKDILKYGGLKFYVEGSFLPTPISAYWNDEDRFPPEFDCEIVTCCYRGHIAEYEILDGRLYVTSVSKFTFEDNNLENDLWDLFFPELKNYVLADWYSGILELKNEGCNDTDDTNDTGLHDHLKSLGIDLISERGSRELKRIISEYRKNKPNDLNTYYVEIIKGEIINWATLENADEIKEKRQKSIDAQSNFIKECREYRERYDLPFEIKTYRKIWTWGRKTVFEYIGSVKHGVTIYYGPFLTNKTRVSAVQLDNLIQKFTGKTVEIGTSRDQTSDESLGTWLKENVNKTAIASYIGPILVHEGYAKRIKKKNYIQFKSRG